VYAWEFEKDDRELRVDVEYRLVQRRIPDAQNGRWPAFSLAYVPKERGATSPSVA
jgi:hypothetical protein